MKYFNYQVMSDPYDVKQDISWGPDIHRETIKVLNINTGEIETIASDPS